MKGYLVKLQLIKMFNNILGICVVEINFGIPKQTFKKPSIT